MKVAIAHDYLTQRGGAERLVLSLVKAFPTAELHTLFYEPDQTYPEYRDVRIRTSGLNRSGLLRKDPRLALPLLRRASDRMHIDADVVIASTSGWAHAFPTAATRIVYCHSPARWLYLEEDYLGQAGRWDPKRIALGALKRGLRTWDYSAAHRANDSGSYLANSSVVQERIRRVYGIDADTLFPPFSPSLVHGAQEPVSALGPGWQDGDHFLVVSRLQPYKNVDRVMEAFRSLPHERLLVIGKGPLGEQLRTQAPANVRFAEGLSDAQMRWAYANARALIAASHEDFGLTPLEAGAHGTPTLALKAGGYLDTIRESVNGIFFEQADAEHIRDAVTRFSEGPEFEADTVRSRALEFSEDRFIRTLRERAAAAYRASSSRAAK